jgi:hypothetical protein
MGLYLAEISKLFLILMGIIIITQRKVQRISSYTVSIYSFTFKYIFNEIPCVQRH